MASIYGDLGDAYDGPDSRSPGPSGQNKTPANGKMTTPKKPDWSGSVKEDDESDPLNPKHVTGINVTKTKPATSPFSTNVFVFSVGKARQTFVIHQSVIHPSAILEGLCDHFVESEDNLKITLAEIDPFVFAALAEYFYHRTWNRALATADVGEGPFLGGLYLASLSLEVASLRSEILSVLTVRKSGVLLLQAAQKVYEHVKQDNQFSVLVVDLIGQLCGDQMHIGATNPEIRQIVHEISSSTLGGLKQLTKDVFKSLMYHWGKEERANAAKQGGVFDDHGDSVASVSIHGGDASEQSFDQLTTIVAKLAIKPNNKAASTTESLGYHIYDKPDGFHDFGDAEASADRETDNPGHLNFPKGARLTKVEYLGTAYEGGQMISLCRGYYLDEFGHFPAHYITLDKAPGQDSPMHPASICGTLVNTQLNDSAVQPESNNRNKTIAEGIAGGHTPSSPWAG